MIPQEKVSKLVEKTREEIFHWIDNTDPFPIVEGDTKKDIEHKKYLKNKPEEVEKRKREEKSHYDIFYFDVIKNSPLMTLEEYLSIEDKKSLREYLSSKNKDRPAGQTAGNPDFYAGISFDKSYELLSRKFSIGEGIEGQISHMTKSKEYHVEGIGYLTDSSREKRTEPFTFYDLYEKLFNLERGTFSTHLGSPGVFLIDNDAPIADYWNYLIENNVPFFLTSVLDMREENRKYHKTNLINGIDI